MFPKCDSHYRRVSGSATQPLAERPAGAYGIGDADFVSDFPEAAKDTEHGNEKYQLV
jgi:hypothetical protein